MLITYIIIRKRDTSHTQFPAQLCDDFLLSRPCSGPCFKMLSTFKNLDGRGSWTTASCYVHLGSAAGVHTVLTEGRGGEASVKGPKPVFVL